MKTEDSLDLRTILVASQSSPTVEWRIRHGILLATLRKPSKWLFWLSPKKWVKASFSIKVTSASGHAFEYNKFILFLTRDRMAEMITILNTICSSNSGAMRYFEYGNESIRKLAYIKQTDFRDVPMLFMVDNRKTEKPVAVNGPNNALGNQVSGTFVRPVGELPRPDFLQ